MVSYKLVAFFVLRKGSMLKLGQILVKTIRLLCLQIPLSTARVQSARHCGEFRCSAKETHLTIEVSRKLLVVIALFIAQMETSCLAVLV
jgi:hypothetical protein